MGLIDLRADADAAAQLARHGAGLLLDLDGTLLDSEPVHQAAFRDTSRPAGGASRTR